MTKLFDSDIEKMIEIYKETKSSKKTAKILNIGSTTVKRHLKKINLLNPQIRYNVKNENIFEKCDTPEKAYWLGFISADGCVEDRKKRTHRLTIGLAKIDKKHLEKFRDFMQIENPVKEYSTSFRVEIINQKICDDLAQYNIIPRKSLVYKFPIATIPPELYSHFLRGSFDGDGYISLSLERNTCNMGFLGTKDLMENFRKILTEQASLPELKILTQDKIFKIGYGGKKNTVLLHDYLYKNSNENIFLDRKKEKFMEALKWIQNTRKQ
jgi:hypothetical protein